MGFVDLKCLPKEAVIVLFTDVLQTYKNNTSSLLVTMRKIRSDFKNLKDSQIC